MKSSLVLAAASLILAGTAWSLPASAANPSITSPKPAAKAAKPANATAKPKDWGGAMPLPVDQRIEKQNSPQDKLVVEVTKSVKVGNDYVAYVKIVWGDLDNQIKGTGKQYYSNWDGSLDITDGTGTVDEKIQFDDGSKKNPAAAPAVTTKTKPAKTAAKPAVKADKTPAGPHTGSGRDELEVRTGTEIEWKAGVVGVLDGLRIKITSPTPDIQASLTAGKFVIPININPGTGTPATNSQTAPKRNGSVLVVP
jgi:hypothetical protein